MSDRITATAWSSVALPEFYLSEREGAKVAVVDDHAYAINAIFYAILDYHQRGNSLQCSVDRVCNELQLVPEQREKLERAFGSFIDRIQERKAKKSKGYIWPKVILIRKGVVKAMVRPFSFLFRAKWLWSTLFILTGCFSLFFLFRDSSNIATLSIEDLWIIFFLSNLFVLVHELGHSAASVAYGGECNHIGFGLYGRFLPVFFSDVTHSWLLPKKERLIVALSGIYFQLIVNAFLIACMFIWDTPRIQGYCVRLISSNLLVIGFSIMPFYRSDGYWLINDWLDRPRLLQDVDMLFFEPKRIFVSKELQPSRFKRIIMPIYAVGYWLFRCYIIFIMSRFVVQTVRTYIDGSWSLNLWSIALFLVCLFGIVMQLSYLTKLFIRNAVRVRKPSFA